nr:MAG TPA: hypothetical protein [Caudoviricetes sp.]
MEFLTSFSLYLYNTLFLMYFQLTFTTKIM